MKVKLHTLFRYLLETADAEPEAFVGLSLAAPPRLGEFLGDLDPDLPLDWNGRSFRGLPDLRRRVLDQAGLADKCSPDDVLITAGAAEANYLVMRQLLEPGDVVVTEAPGWPQAAVLAQATGAELRVVPRDEAQAWRFDPAVLAAAVCDRTRLIFLTNPNNPTGALLDQAALADVVRIADRVGAWLLVDEVYAGLEWDRPRAPAVAGLYPRGITTGSVSKALGLQGLRTGWLICRDPGLVMDAVILRENASEIMNILGEHIALAALEPARLATRLATVRTEGRGAIGRLDRFVAETPGLSWVRPEAGLIGLARLPPCIDSETFARRLLGPPWRTFVLPGAAYGMPGHIRLGAGGGAAANLETGLDRLADCLARWGG
ncbi:MAG: aminotransferase class I/II-fold pyridoxal phosphate-dependent enzyme [Gemmobacter sp.]